MRKLKVKDRGFLIIIIIIIIIVLAVDCIGYFGLITTAAALLHSTA